MVKISRKEVPEYLAGIEWMLNLQNFDLIEHQYEGLYEFIFKKYPELLPDDSVTLHDIIDDITPELVLEFLVAKGRVIIC